MSCEIACPRDSMPEFMRLSRLAFRCLHGLEAQEDCRPVDSQTAGSWLQAARAHRVAGLWDAALPLAEMVPSVADSWRSLVRGQMFYNVRLTAAAERIAAELGPGLAGLKLVKGPALDRQAWPRPGIRIYDDLDFRCARCRYDELARGLASLGYRPEFDDPVRMDNLWTYGWGVSFIHQEGFRAEFNHRLFPPHYPNAEARSPDACPVWGPIRLDSAEVTAPSPAFHLLLACLHAVWHEWERLVWIADIAGLVARDPSIVPQAENLAGSKGFQRRALEAGCATAQRLFGPLPGLPPLPEKAASLAAQAEQTLSGARQGSPFEHQRRLHDRLMSPAERGAYHLRRITTPGDPDFTAVPLSAPFRLLYWLMRPWRLLATRFRSLLSR